MDNDQVRWKNSSRVLRLHQRQQVVSSLREYLYSEGFLEVETPILVKSTCPDTWIDSVKVGDDYLVTSTEYQIKRMMVGGFEKIFTLGKNFRANDRGSNHSTEFTMLEWARAHDSLHSIEEDAVQFIRQAFRKLYPNQNSCTFKGSEIDYLSADWERITVRKALEVHLGLKNLEDFSFASLSKATFDAGISLPENFDNRYIVTSYLLDILQTHLGKKTPTFLQEWPSFMTTSAPVNSLDPYIAERSELYIGGIEISNGFPFLTDAQKQRDLFQLELHRRKEEGKPAVIMDERFLDALSLGLPSGAGMALGVDRLVMVLTGATQTERCSSFRLGRTLNQTNNRS